MRGRRQWGVYRLFDRDGALLYVGKGFNGADDRLADHRRKEWGGEIRSRSWKPCRSERHALAVERSAIRNEGPLFNIVHNGGRGRRNAALLRRVNVTRYASLRPQRSRWRVWLWWPVPVFAGVGWVLLEVSR